MEGIYGYVGYGADVQEIKKIAFLAESKNTAVMGFSFLKDGNIYTVKNKGSILDNMEYLKLVAGATVVIGYTGSEMAVKPWNNVHEQPIHLASEKNSTAVVHCGHVHNKDVIFTNYDYSPTLQHDSEALWLLLARGGYDVVEIQLVLMKHSILAIRGKEFLVMNNNLPLFEDNVPTGRVYCTGKISEKSVKLIRFGESIRYQKYCR